jgi:hypothetical protein
MNMTLLLACDFIERAASADYSGATNDEYTLRWLMLRAGGDPVRALNIVELGPNDIDALSLEAWLWLGGNLGEKDPELPAPLVEALFMATEDLVYRLRVADVSLRHPALNRRYSGLPRPLADTPASWGRDRLIRLISGAGDRNGLVEMAAILLQVGNKAALQLLNGLRRQARDVVDETLATVTGRQEGSLLELISQLGLNDVGR